MIKKMETTIGFRAYSLEFSFSFRVYGGHEGLEKNMETAIMGCIGTTIRIHGFIHANLG